MDGKRKSEIIRELLPDWLKLKSEVEKEEYISTLAVKLHLAEQTINKEIHRLTAEIRPTRGKRNNPKENWDNNTKDRYTVVERVVAYILKDETAFARFKEEIGLEVFTDESYSKLLQLYDMNLAEHPQIELIDLKERAMELGITDTWAKLMMLEKSEADQIYVTDFIAEVKNRRHIKKWESLIQEFSAHSQSDFDDIARLLYRFNRQLIVTRKGGIK